MEIAVTERGRGPAVVLIHGAPSSTVHFDALVDALAIDHRVLVPSLPGYGASPRLDPYSIDGVRDCLLATLHTRGVTRAALVGFSFGAYHALHAAVSGFDATAVVCLGGFAVSDPAAAPAIGGLAAMIRAMPDLRDPGFRAMFAARMTSESFRAAHGDIAAGIAEWLDATTPDVLADELTAGAAVEDLRPRLAGLAIPVIARVGELDVAAPPSASEAIARACRRGALQVVVGCGHALLVEDGPATIAAIRAAVA